jgi:hypothetical protein
LRSLKTFNLYLNDDFIGGTTNFVRGALIYLLSVVISLICILVPELFFHFFHFFHYPFFFFFFFFFFQFFLIM